MKGRNFTYSRWNGMKVVCLTNGNRLSKNFLIIWPNMNLKKSSSIKIYTTLDIMFLKKTNKRNSHRESKKIIWSKRNPTLLRFLIMQSNFFYYQEINTFMNLMIILHTVMKYYKKWVKEVMVKLLKFLITRKKNIWPLKLSEIKLNLINRLLSKFKSLLT